jgi:hypothetical protein
MIDIDFDFSGLDDEYRRAEDELYREITLRLMRIGEMYVSTARANGNYTDQTTNLRTAHGYIVYRDGVSVFESIGRPETMQMFEEMKTGIGVELIVGDGMNYASFVEGKGYDVSTSGMLKVESEVRKLAS